MEQGNSFFHYSQSEKSSSDSKGEEKKQKKKVEGECEESKPGTVPIACVQRMMRKALPRHAKLSDESKVLMLHCVTDFISFITGVANQRCQEEKRTTVTAQDLIYAMAKLGFDNYAHCLTLYLHRYRQHHHQPSNPVPHRAPPITAATATPFPFPLNVSCDHQLAYFNRHNNSFGK